MKRAKIVSVLVHEIIVTGKRPAADQDYVRNVADSLAKIRTYNPITVRIITDGVFELIEGRDLLDAAQLLGWKSIDAIVIDGRKGHGELVTIAQDLRHLDFWPLRRAEAIARWRQLREELHTKRADVPGGREQQDGEIGDLAAHFKVLPQVLRTSQSIADISAPAKAIAIQVGLDQDCLALVEIAAEETSESQVQKAKELAERKQAEGPRFLVDQARQLRNLRRRFERARKLRAAWIAAAKPARERFVTEILNLG